MPRRQHVLGCYPTPVLLERFAMLASQATTHPPIDYAIAVWVGMPRDEIVRGLRGGWVRRPQGASADWLPGDPQPEEGSGVSGPVDGELPSADRSVVRSWLTRIDPVLDDTVFADIWNEAGSNDRSRAGALTTFVARALGIAQTIDSEAGATRDAIERALDSLPGTARIVRLGGRSGTDLGQVAQHDAGMRRALAEHSPWAVLDNRTLVRVADTDGRFDRFDPDTGEVNVSNAWILDRARHAAWRMSAGDGTPEVAGDGWRFIDRAAGASATVEVGGAHDTVHQVVFARDDGDHVIGGATTDRVHGGIGDDVLRGRAGDDLIEGGKGHDVLQGGSGRDDLVGQQGDDEVEGGAGADRLDGGSGNDDLDGGRGDDILLGGSGDDVYRFESGDGTDTIVDDSGVIVLDDVAVGGTMRRESGAWHSEDGRIRFEVEDANPQAGLTLHSVDGTTIRLPGWKQGAFGITLDSIEEEPEDAASGSGFDAQDLDSEDAVSASAGAMSGEIGNEAPSSPPDVPTPNSDETQLSALGTDPLGGATLVDSATLLQAAQSWNIPTPPDVGTHLIGDPSGVTIADVAEAMADDLLDEAEAEGVPTLSGGEWLSDMGIAHEPSPVRLPPETLLRRTS